MKMTSKKIESFNIIDAYTGSSVNGSAIRFNKSDVHSDISMILNFSIASNDFGGLCIDSEDLIIDSVLTSYQNDPLQQNTLVQTLEEHSTVFVGRNLYSTEALGGRRHRAHDLRVQHQGIFRFGSPYESSDHTRIQNNR